MSGTFRSVRNNRNAQLFFLGMLASNIGTWVQFTAVAIIVDRLTGKTTSIGILSALQFGPMLVLGAWAGAVADRVDRRKMTILTQSALALQATALAVLDLTGTITIEWIYALTFVLGVISALDNPARRGFVTELVPEEQITNAVSLNSALMTGSRIIGPALGGLLVATVGFGWAFFFNGLTYLAVLAGLRMIDQTQVRPAPVTPRGKGQVRAGLAYAWSITELRVPLLMMTVIGTFAFNFQTVLPLFAVRDLDGRDITFSLLMSVVSVGSLIGALRSARRTSVSVHTVSWRCGRPAAPASPCTR